MSEPQSSLLLKKQLGGMYSLIKNIYFNIIQ